MTPANHGIDTMLADSTVPIEQRMQLLMHLLQNDSTACRKILAKVLDDHGASRAAAVEQEKLQELDGLIRSLREGPARKGTFLRSVGGTLRALVPNVWPVLVLLGGMGWLGVRLDLATVMVASIVLGLAVDDTIHTLAHFRAEARELGARAAVARRIERAAPAYLLTGAILVAGFGVCALSEFQPIARFGELAAAAIVLALASDLLLVPALFGGEE